MASSKLYVPRKFRFSIHCLVFVAKDFSAGRNESLFGLIDLICFVFRYRSIDNTLENCFVKG